MSLITTAGASNADSYASLSEANAYFTARGVTTWTGEDATKENALRRATTYLDNAYRGRWIGVRTEQVQSLAWPRCNSETTRTGIGFTIALFDNDGFEIPTDAVPTQVKNATIEAALLALTGTTLEPTLARGNAIKQETIGPLSVTYRDDAPAVDRYTAIEGYLRGLVTGTPGASSGTVRLVRG